MFMPMVLDVVSKDPESNQKFGSNSGTCTYLGMVHPYLHSYKRAFRAFFCSVSMRTLLLLYMIFKEIFPEYGIAV